LTKYLKILYSFLNDLIASKNQNSKNEIICIYDIKKDEDDKDDYLNNPNFK